MSLQHALREQAESCVALGSPFMGRLLTLLATDWSEDSALAKSLAHYTGDIGPRGHSLPLRIAGGLHALVLSGRSPTLAQVYPPHEVSDKPFRTAVLNAIQDDADFLCDWVKSAPQTNEVRRSVALIAGARVATQHFDLPIILSELGASGGLNLMWDHYALKADDTVLGSNDPVLTLSPEWSGPVPDGPRPVVASRAGVDLNPLNPQNPDDLLRMTAYLWPDQPDRMALTRAAASAMTAPIAKGDAIDWLEQRLATQPTGQMHMIQHTIAWQYFPADVQARGQALIEAAGARATNQTPLAWLSMENDGDATGKIGAAVVLRLWPGDITLPLARADFHGRWINWTGVD